MSTRELAQASGYVSVALGPALVSQLDRLAAERLISRSALLKQIVADALAALGRIERSVSVPRGRAASRRLLDRAAR
jgi:predicted transcriptional regulator